MMRKGVSYPLLTRPKTAGSAVVVSLLLIPGIALAADTPDTVTANAVTVSACGAQSLTFAGSATYSEPTQHLVVTLDGTELLHSHLEPDTWSTGLLAVGVGSHTLTASLYDHADHEDLLASNTKTFTVAACGGAPAPSAVSSGGTGRTGGTGSGGDCCPGPDPVQPAQKATQGKVKGAAAKKVSAATLPVRVTPINELFRKVYGRGPTFAEWEYWTVRILSDKPQFDAIYGAMQWHKLRGHTTGGPHPILLK